MKEAKFNVVLINGQPWLEWDQYTVTHLRIWKAKSDRPYCKYNGMTVYLDERLIEQLKNLLKL